MLKPDSHFQFRDLGKEMVLHRSSSQRGGTVEGPFLSKMVGI